MIIRETSVRYIPVFRVLKPGGGCLILFRSDVTCGKVPCDLSRNFMKADDSSVFCTLFNSIQIDINSILIHFNCIKVTCQQLNYRSTTMTLGLLTETVSLYWSSKQPTTPKKYTEERLPSCSIDNCIYSQQRERDPE